MRRVMIIVVFMFAARSHAADVPRAVANEVRRYGRDSISMLRAPLHWDQDQWTRAAATVAAVAGAAAIDEQTARLTQRNRSDVSEDFSRIVTPFGGRRALVISGALLGSGLLLKNPELRDTGRDALEASFLAGGIVTPVLKRAVGRSRPFKNDGAYAFDPLSENQSFPSGHATNAFAVASVIAGHSRGWLVPTIAYTLATGVAVSRVHDDVHFASDVLAGAAIGTAIGRAVVARRRPAAKKRAFTVDIMPLRSGVAVFVRVLRD